MTVLLRRSIVLVSVCAMSWLATAGGLAAAGAVGSPHEARAGAAVPPRIGRVVVTTVRDSSAIVHATIIANGLPTTTYVRVGTSSAFSVASPVRSVGSAATPVTVTIAIGGLVSDTTYDFDVVAHNTAGTTISAEESFVTTGAPRVVSETVTSLETTAASLGGAIDPDGHPANWYLQYGPTASYGSRTAVAHLGPSTSPIPVGRTVVGLVPNTTYHFRLVAESSDGTVSGGDVTFATLGPTLSTSVSNVTAGRSLTLSGTVPDGLANEVVSIYAQATYAPSFVEVASVLTGAGGSWGYQVAPRIGTTFKAVWDNEVTPTIGVNVSPSVRLRELLPGTFYTRVIGATTFVGRTVRLERLEHGIWRTIAFAHLNRGSNALLRPKKLGPGLSRLRAFFSAYQAGTGYLAGKSKVVDSRH